MRLTALLATIALTASLTPALAQTPQLKAGLWEHSMTLKSESGQVEGLLAIAQAQVQNMPAEQRESVERMLAQRGVSLGAKANTVRQCISPEQAERGEIPQGERCTQEVLQRSSTSMRLKFNCEGPPPTQGEGEFTLTSPTRYRGNARVQTLLGGRTENVTMAVTGTWLAAECGTLKPAR